MNARTLQPGKTTIIASSEAEDVERCLLDVEVTTVDGVGYDDIRSRRVKFDRRPRFDDDADSFVAGNEWYLWAVQAVVHVKIGPAKRG